MANENDHDPLAVVANRALTRCFVVALSYLNSNVVPRPIRRRRSPDAVEPSRYAAPPGQRRARITPKLRAEVVAPYQRGESSRKVAEACGVAKTTVLMILKSEGVELRLQGRRY
jgi:hypothetical protein